MTQRLTLHVMDGAGNAYAFADMRAQTTAAVHALAQDAHAISAAFDTDGLIMACASYSAPSDHAKLDMRIFNADGSEGMMCGNGLRCLAQLAREQWGISHDTWSVQTPAGVRCVQMLPNGPRVSMGEAAVAQDPPWFTPGPMRPIPVAQRGTIEPIPVDVGNPHLVLFAADSSPWTEPEVRTLGPRVAQDRDVFPHGVNVQFASVLAADQLELMSWERGSGYTLACGTGACAAVAAGWHTSVLNHDRVRVRTPGGELLVEREGTALWLSGPVRYQRTASWPPEP